MTREPTPKRAPNQPEPHRIRLPGFVPDEPVGLGDAVKGVTSLMGIRPCGACTERAHRLNNWAVLSGRKR
jgi:hypothetical protein